MSEDTNGSAATGMEQRQKMWKEMIDLKMTSVSFNSTDLACQKMKVTAEEQEDLLVCMELPAEEENFKLDEGEIIIYPSTYLHSVEEVTFGERLVFIGWIESYIKSIEEREYLFDLDAAARSLLAKYGRSNEVDLIYKSYSNLLRRLGS